MGPIKLLPILVAFFLLPVGQAGFADSDYGKQKVVYHINSLNPMKQAGALRNMQNHVKAVGAENLDLKVVLHGFGLSLLLNPESLGRLKKIKKANATKQVTAKIDRLRKQGVEFKVCGNSMRGLKIDPETDLHGVSKQDVVPSGVAELAALQAQGYAYIRP